MNNDLNDFGNTIIKEWTTEVWCHGAIITVKQDNIPVPLCYMPKMADKA